MNAATEIRRAPSQNRYEALLRVTKAIASSEDCCGMADTFTTKLREVVSLDYLHFVGFDHESGTPRCQLLEAGGQRLDGPLHNGSSKEDPIAWVFEHQKPLVTDDWIDETAFPEHRKLMLELGVLSTCTLPVVHGRRRVGVLSVGRSLRHAYSEEEVHFVCLVADQVGLAKIG